MANTATNQETTTTVALPTRRLHPLTTMRNVPTQLECTKKMCIPMSDWHVIRQPPRQQPEIFLSEIIIVICSTET